MGTYERRTSSHWGAFTARVVDDRLVGVRPFERDPYPSDLIDSTASSVYAPTRILQPMVRRGWLDDGPDSRGRRGGEAFVPVAWDKALDLAAGELDRVRRTHGNMSIFGGSYGWASAGRFHHARTQLHRFLHGFGGCVQQVTNYSCGAAKVLLPHLLGSEEATAGPVTSWASIAKHTKLMVMFGGAGLKNGQVCAGGPGEHSFEKWLRLAREAGVEFINIGPVRTDAPDFLDAEWLAPRPNSDTALMLGMAHTLHAEGLHDRAFLDRWCVGFDRFERYLTGADDGVPKDADWAAPLTEIPAETIRGLARRMAGTRTMLTASWSLQRADHGEQPFWMMITLAAMLGQIGLPGGGFGFGYGSIGGMGNPRLRLAVPDLPSGRNPLAFAIPVARIADLLLQPGETIDFNGRKLVYPDIRLVYWAGGNPFHHHQDLNRLVRASQRPDTVIVHEPWWTSVARHADIVLPATTTLERNDVGASSRDRFVMAMPKVIEPVGEARNDFDIFRDLAGRLGFADAFTEGRDEMAWVRHLYDVARGKALAANVAMADFDTFWRDGFVEFPEPLEDHVMLGDFRRDPDAHPLKTRSGRIEIFSEEIAGYGYDDCPGHATWLEPAEWLGGPAAARHPLHLISNQPRTRLHGQLDDGLVSRESKIAGREPMWINPADAAPRGIADGDIVVVHNDRGRCLAGAIVTEDVRPGVIQLPAGAWFDPAEPGRVGSLDKHGNPNVLTMDKGTSRLGQGPIALTALVEVERLSGDAPAVTAFLPPAVA
ncbi:MAG: molybdopterin guanine dinucleotide-containing S/N-oxide reductase [Alphaproteobacteria bacterium]